MHQGLGESEDALVLAQPHQVMFALERLFQTEYRGVSLNASVLLYLSIQLDELGKTVEIQIRKRGASPAFTSGEASFGIVGVAGAGRTRRSGLSNLPSLLGRNKTWSVPEDLAFEFKRFNDKS